MEYLGSDMSTEELMHYGRKGMKWYQNIFSKGKLGGKKGRSDNTDNSPDEKNKSSSSSSGSKSVKNMSDEELTSAIARAKSVKDMTDTELALATRRAQLEEQYTNLTKSRGRRFIEDMWDRSVSPALQEAGKNLVKDKLIDMGKKYLGLDNEDTVAALEKEVKNLRLTKEKTEIKDWLDKKSNGTKSKEDEEKEYMDNLKNEVNKRTLEKKLKDFKAEEAAEEAKKNATTKNSESESKADDVERVKGTVEKDKRTAKEKWDASNGPIHDVDFDEPISSSNVRDLVVVGQSFFDEYDKK